MILFLKSMKLKKLVLSIMKQTAIISMNIWDCYIK